MDRSPRLGCHLLRRRCTDRLNMTGPDTSAEEARDGTDLTCSLFQLKNMSMKNQLSMKQQLNIYIYIGYVPSDNMCPFQLKNRIF